MYCWGGGAAHTASSEMADVSPATKINHFFNASPVTRTCTSCLTTDVSRIYADPGMIESYRDRRTEAFAAGEFVPAFQGFEQQAARRLSILNAARSLDTLRALRSNRL